MRFSGPLIPSLTKYWFLRSFPNRVRDKRRIFLNHKRHRRKTHRYRSCWNCSCLWNGLIKLQLETLISFALLENSSDFYIRCMRWVQQRYKPRRSSQLCRVSQTICISEDEKSASNRRNYSCCPGLFSQTSFIWDRWKIVLSK